MGKVGGRRAKGPSSVRLFSRRSGCCPRSDQQAPFRTRRPPHHRAGRECARPHPSRAEPPGQVGGPTNWREREPMRWPDRCPEWMRPGGDRLSGAL